MPAAEQKLRDGRLEEALVELQTHLRKHPTDVKQRIFLFQLLVILGQWERALNQLNVIDELDASTLAMVQTYREALRCEAFRREVFTGQRSPLLLGSPESWVALLLEALHLRAQGQLAHSQDLRNQAFESAPPTSGHIDGQDFQWIADADSRLGPVLEAIVNGRYYWIPFQGIREIHIEEPSDLRDLVWLPAHFTWANGGTTVGFIPTRYPDSETSTDNQIRMARKTEWIAQITDVYFGLGQRMLATDTQEYPLLDIRLLTLNTAGDA